MSSRWSFWCTVISRETKKEKPTEYLKAYVSQSIGSSLWESRFNNWFDRSLMAEIVKLWPCFLLRDGFAFGLLDNSPTELESPPERTSMTNLTSNKSCKTPFSVTWWASPTSVERKPSKIPTTCMIKYSHCIYRCTRSQANRHLLDNPLFVA